MVRPWVWVEMEIEMEMEMGVLMEHEKGVLSGEVDTLGWAGVRLGGGDGVCSEVETLGWRSWGSEPTTAGESQGFFGQHNILHGKQGLWFGVWGLRRTRELPGL